MIQNTLITKFNPSEDKKIERTYPHPIRKASKLGLTITKRCFCHGILDLRFQQQTLLSLRQQDAPFRDLTCQFLETPTTKTYNWFYQTTHWCQIHSKNENKIWYLALFQKTRKCCTLPSIFSCVFSLLAFSLFLIHSLLAAIPVRCLSWSLKYKKKILR